uniref:Lysine-specific metallo-endopeptidase domain-containing protein n=1 Tax=Moniliophthora roreri TaxID=221103 RepID=A0A0W0FUJ8_MONRR
MSTLVPTVSSTFAACTGMSLLPALEVVPSKWSSEILKVVICGTDTTSFSTIIHKGTHFPQVLGTDDYTYSESSCKSLARSNPTNAVYNADNHAFFSDYA